MKKSNYKVEYIEKCQLNKYVNENLESILRCNFPSDDFRDYIFIKEAETNNVIAWAELYFYGETNHASKDINPEYDRLKYQNMVELSKIFVANNYKGKGITKLIVKKLIKKLKKSNYIFLISHYLEENFDDLGLKVRNKAINDIKYFFINPLEKKLTEHNILYIPHNLKFIFMYLEQNVFWDKDKIFDEYTNEEKITAVEYVAYNLMKKLNIHNKDAITEKNENEMKEVVEEIFGI